MGINSHRDLDVWQIGMDLAQSCYTCTSQFPKEETYGLTSQIRRAASSIPANIAEGYGRDNTGDYIHMLRIANGSLKELETHVELSHRIGLLAPDKATELSACTDRLGRMLRALIRSLQK